MTLEERINDNVEYWLDEYEKGDLNLFKMELEDGESEDMINDKLISDHVSSIYQKGNYLYIELRQLDLDEYFDDKWKEWINQRELENDEYWESRF